MLNTIEKKKRGEESQMTRKREQENPCVKIKGKKFIKKENEYGKIIWIFYPEEEIFISCIHNYLEFLEIGNMVFIKDIDEFGRVMRIFDLETKIWINGGINPLELSVEEKEILFTSFDDFGEIKCIYKFELQGPIHIYRLDKNKQIVEFYYKYWREVKVEGDVGVKVVNDRVYLFDKITKALYDEDGFLLTGDLD